MRNQRPRIVLDLRLLLLGVFLLGMIYAAQRSQEASISIRVYDEQTGSLTPVRVTLAGADGSHPEVAGALAVSQSAIGVPEGAVAVMYGRSDTAQGDLLQPDGSFYADGTFGVKMPAGSYTLTLSKGYEFLTQTHTLALKPGEQLSRDFRLERWIDMPARGWYSGDDHIHLRRSQRDDPAIVRWLAAEDIHVGHLLQMGDFWTTVFSQYAFGEPGVYQEGDYIVAAGQEEPRTPEIGHTISLGASQFVRDQRDYYSYDTLFDKVHELGGITGFAHQGLTFHGYRGMTLNVLRDKVDFLELLQFCAPGGPLAEQNYYHFLDLGYRLTALAGSDFPWCGRGPRFGFEQGHPQIGDARFYARAGDPLQYGRWMEAVRAGRTFVTSGPMLDFKVNETLPGETIEAVDGAKLKVTATAYGHAAQVPLSKLEIVVHGQTLRGVSSDEPGQTSERLSIAFELPVDHGLWIAARCEAGQGQFAHSTPVYVRVGSDGFENPATVSKYVEASRGHLDELEGELANPGQRMDNQAAKHRVSLERQIAEARGVLKSLESRLLRK